MLSWNCNNFLVYKENAMKGCMWVKYYLLQGKHYVLFVPWLLICVHKNAQINLSFYSSIRSLVRFVLVLDISTTNNNFVFFKIALNPIILYARTKAVHFKRQYPSSYFIHGDQILYVSHLYHNDENLFPQTWS